MIKLNTESSIWWILNDIHILMTISHLKKIIYNNIISSQVNQILFFRVFNYLDWLILEGEEKRGWCPGSNEERPPGNCPPSRGRHCLGRKRVLWHWRHVNWAGIGGDSRITCIIGFYVVHPWDYSLSLACFCCSFTFRLFCLVYFAGVQVSVIFKVSLQLSWSKFPSLSRICFSLTRNHHRHTGQQIRSHSKFQEEKSDLSATIILGKPATFVHDRVSEQLQSAPARVFAGGCGRGLGHFSVWDQSSEGCGRGRSVRGRGVGQGQGSW